MYPLLCPGGYGVPMKTGKFDIEKITAVCSDTDAAARLQLWDTTRNMPASKTKDDRMILDLKRIAVCDANIEFDCPSPIKVRDTLYPFIMTNLVPGSVLVYIK